MGIGAAVRAAEPAILPGRQRAYAAGTPCISPLRYPGAKRRLVGYVADTLAAHALSPGLFVELFAGGASVAIQLLSDEVVERIGLVDRDPRIAAFWATVFNDSAWLLDQIDVAPLDLHEWRRHRAVTNGSRRELALACLYLNRTSFSGILAPRAGPLGGTKSFDQERFSCRFPRETLKRRVAALAELRARVDFTWALDWNQALSLVRRMQRRGSLDKSVFYFVDPPFFEKAERLYAHTFTAAGHRRLRDALLDMSPAREPWLLSYDSLPMVQELYGEQAATVTIDRFYTTSRLVAGQPLFAEALVTNLPSCPEPARLFATERT
jgi:DNA adenine methylase